MRKSEVFDFAARHASGAERARFLDRAAFFWRYSVTTLLGLPTSTFTRPLVLMLAHGSLRAYMESHPHASAPSPAAAQIYDEPVVFVAQKTRAKRRVVAIAALISLATVVAAGATLFLLLY